MTHINNPKNTEVDAYTYIKEQLEILGWIVKNPARNINGEVYKQNEVLAHKELKKLLVRDMPEAVIKLSPTEFWVIESKRNREDNPKAISEAKNQYAKKINKSKKIKCVIISGVSGNDTDGYVVRNQFLRDGIWKDVIFNGKTKNILLSKEQAQYIITHNTFKWTDLPDIPEEKYISAAVEINEILHNAGINKNKRARFIAGLVLSLSLDSEINLRETDTTSLVESVNVLIKKKLRSVGKENFIDFLKLELPPSQENHVKYKIAITETLKELATLDIKNAMASGKDILGEFYEKFLKYGNGAKEIGIVLTPRHITEFAVDLLDIKFNDFILDPTCGTGGFLVSSFDYVKRNSSKAQINKFKNHNLFGIEQDDEVVALALVNMIFRGDGRNNIREGNCFHKDIIQIVDNGQVTGKFIKKEDNDLTQKKIITKVLMNPPFALKKGDEKEYKFIDYALSQMEDGGLLFAILPSPIMFKGNKVKKWREKLFKENTLKAVIKFPEDLFYPVGVHTSAVIIKKGTPHNFNDDVFWGKLSDGYFKKKGAMRKKESGNIEFVKSVLKDFLNNSGNIIKNKPKEYSIEPIYKDKDLECAPEYYLKEEQYSDKQVINKMINTYFELVDYLIKNPFFKGINININKTKNINPEENLDDIFIIENAKSKNIEDYGNGEMPFVTSTSNNNGIEKYIDEDDEKLIYRNPCITVSSFGQANVQITPFVARSHGAVIVLIPKKKLSLIQLIFYASQINIHCWRFSYGRWVTKKRLLKLEIQNINQIKLPTIGRIKKPFEKKIKFIMESFTS